ncbi:hypothetical protein K2X85_18320 [bacterium]|nr:hypothetical protein [bacterium]
MRKETEDRAFEAFVVSTFRDGDLDVPTGIEDAVELTADDMAMLKRVNKGLIQRILDGEFDGDASVSSEDDEPSGEEAELALSGAGNELWRAEDVDEGTQAELDEIDREILERKLKEKQGE